MNPFGYEEFFYTADSGNSTIVPIDKNWQTIGLQCSGGLDSTLLLYLTAKTLKNLGYNIKILPISFMISSKISNPKFLSTNIRRIQNLVDTDSILPVMEVYVPYDQCSKEAIDSFDGKNKFMGNVLVELKRNKKIDIDFNGNTKNPPEHIRKNFINDRYRVVSRDSRTSIYNGSSSAAPHAFMDKADIINLYIKEGLVEVLAGSTLSCDAFIDRIVDQKLTIPCKKCWWCDERAYGFRANGISDPGEERI